MSVWTKDETKKIANEVAAKAAKDPKLQKLALEDPAAAIKQVTGRDTPAGMVLKFSESGTGLNAAMAVEESDIDDSALAQVAGGSCCHIPNALQIGCGQYKMK